MKRFLAFLILFLVAGATFTPCCSTDDCLDEVSAYSQPDHKKGDDNMGCSPFIACGTCTGFTATVEPIILPAPPEQHTQFFEIEFAYNSSTCTASPWQPPRLV